MFKAQHLKVAASRSTSKSRVIRAFLNHFAPLLYSIAMNRILTLVVSLLMVSTPLIAAEDGIIVRTARVFQEANPASTAVGQISAGSRVSIFARSGGWKEIYSEEKSMLGWIRGYQVREGSFTETPEAKKEPDSRGVLGGLASFSRKASSFFNIGGGSTSSSTATLGVRGLSEEQIKSAEPDPEQLKRMQGYASTPKRVTKFQSAGKLNSREVDYLASKHESASKPKATEK